MAIFQERTVGQSRVPRLPRRRITSARIDLLTSLLRRLPRAAAIENGLLKIQANHLTEMKRGSRLHPASRVVV